MMRIFGLLITLAMCGALHAAAAQGSKIILPDTISLSSDDLRKVFECPDDTLGFRKLTCNTSLKDYKGKENRKIRRTIRRIQFSIQGNILYDEIAGQHISMLRNFTYANGPGEHHILYSPKYALIRDGVVIMGEQSISAPWNDIVTDRVRLDCYLVSFDKKVSYIQTVPYSKI